MAAKKAAAKKVSKKKASKKKAAKASKRKKVVGAAAKKARKNAKDGLLNTLALVYQPLTKKLNDRFNNNRDEYFAKFKAAVGNDPANYKFGGIVRRLPDQPGSAIGMEPDPNNAHNPNKWALDVDGIHESDRKLLQTVIAGNIFSKEPMLFDFDVQNGKKNPRVEVSTHRKGGAHVLKIVIFCAE